MLARTSASFAVIILLAVGSAASGCVGARPLAMGGAFVGLADDANATYWNPAGLARFESPKATMMYTATSQHEINYQSYWAYGGRIAQGGTGYGISYIRERIWLPITGDDDQTWLWFSGAFRSRNDTAVGVNVRFIDDSLPGLSTDVGFDLSFLRVVNDKVSVGLMIQNVNEPGMEIGGRLVARYERNIRPGIAYRYAPDSVVTLDMYDMLNHSGTQAVRLGFERRLPKGFAVRAGCYGVGSGGGITLGMGGPVGNVSVDAALVAGELDRTLLVSASSQY